VAPHRLDVIPWIPLRGAPGGASTNGRNFTWGGGGGGGGVVVP